MLPAGPTLHLGGPQKLYQLAGGEVHQLGALAPGVLLWTTAQVVILDNDRSLSRLIPNTIGNRIRDCAWGWARGIHTTWENLQIEKHKSVRWAERTPPDLCLSIWRFPQVVCIPRAQPHAQSLFSISNSFGIDLINFFDEKKDGSAENSIACFGASIPCHAIWQS